MNAKQIAAEKAVELIKDRMIVGLGSGSTASYAIQKIGERVKAGLKITAVASSVKSEDLARECGIPLRDPSEIESIDMAIDGADEVDTQGNLIKGGGGSLLREKVIAFASERFYVVVDDSKLVTRLGKFPLPVEIIPFAANLTLTHLNALGCEPVIRTRDGENFITDNGNLIVDCSFHQIDEPAWLDVKIKMIPGVVETGLFSHKVVTSLFVSSPGGKVKVIALEV
jgi:ribose 5-phosphate isomerase A